MGLPQEVVDRIMDMLQDDRRALEGCSLTCKAMFVSTRHLIHQTLHVTKENNQRILTPKEKKQHARGNYLLELRFLSFMGERDLLKYTRHLNISIGCFAFSPNILEPHLQHFKSLDRVNTLTIYSYDSVIWRHVYNTHFSQFHPTLTTLVLRSLTSHYRFVLQFVLQFPSLENLTLKYLRHETGEYSGISVPSKVTQYPPLNGRLRCASLYSGDPEWTKEFAFGPLGGINFRSVEFRDVHREHGQHILDGCASSLEEFTVRITGDGKKESPPRLNSVQPRLNSWFTSLARLQLRNLHFRENRSLRSITLRIPFSCLPELAASSLWTSLSTITSLAFCKFVLELGGAPFGFFLPPRDIWGNWNKIDKLFSCFLDRHPGFELVIKVRLPPRSVCFKGQVREIFPSMAGREGIRFETFLADEYWCKCLPRSVFTILRIQS